MVLLEFSIYPLDKGVSLSPYVARAVEIVAASGLDYQIHAMGTIVEGEYAQVMDVVRRCFEVLARDCDRVECVLRFDYRKDRQGTLRGKVESVERHLGRELQK
jgi:uncharacterized protein (TIGR00106 family)